MDKRPLTRAQCIACQGIGFAFGFFLLYLMGFFR